MFPGWHTAHEMGLQVAQGDLATPLGEGTTPQVRFRRSGVTVLNPAPKSLQA